MIDEKKNMNVASRSKESIAWSLMVAPSLQVVQFAVSIIIARILDPRDFGIMGIATVIVFYANSMSDFGFGDAIVRIKKMTDGHVETFFTLNLLISFSLFLFFFSTANFFAGFFAIPELSPVLRVMAVIFPITTFYSIPLALLRRQLSYKVIAQINIVKQLCGMSCTLLLVLCGVGYWALVFGTVLANIMAATVIFFRSGWHPSVRWHRRAFKEIIGFASWKFVAVQVNILSSYMDKLIVGKILGPVMLGYYEKSFGLSFMPVQHIAQRIGFVMFSSFSRVQTDVHEIQYFLKRSLVLTTVICLPALLGLYAIADQFVLVLLGRKWLPMLPCFKVLLFAFAVACTVNPFETLNLSCGNYRRQVYMKIAALVILVCLLLITTRHGIKQAAYVILLYNLLLLFITYKIASLVIDIRVQDVARWIFPAMICSILMIVAVRILQHWLRLDGTPAGLLLLCVAGAVTYVGAMFALDFQETRFLKKEAMKVLKRIPVLYRR